jgi:hypothetical protein
MKFALSLAVLLSAAAFPAVAQKAKKVSSPSNKQKIDEAYSQQIRQYTTEPFFLTEIVDHLPASATVPNPEKVLGYAIGTPNRLTYTTDIYRYMRELANASPRVRIFNAGQSEEGREMMLVVIADVANIKKLDQYKQITARLADPRKTPPNEATQLITDGLPFYWASGSIRSPETGSPEMLMELAYRLAVEESPMIQNIRKNSIILITPTIEVDGRDKAVDIYNYRKANPGKVAPSLVYWGKYVAHDNNRDAMGMTLELSRSMMRTFLEYHPTVLHDLHESVPFLYISTGMGPYNPWLDPIVINEWQKMAYNEIEEMTKRGVPGVWTHGFYDGWAANYMFYVANGHNSIGRFYETFGGRGADTEERTVAAAQTSRTWFRPNPPLAKVKWSLRNNINLQQSALLLGMNYAATNKKQFLENFYLKSKRSVSKAATEGPAAWVLPSDETRPAQAAEFVGLLQQQGIEIHKTRQEVELAKSKIPTGSYVIRMDQPYSRMADMLLDTQYYNVNDPRPYDDTGWSLGPLRNVKTHRVTDAKILSASMEILTGAPPLSGAVTGSGSVYLINHNTDNTLATLRWSLKNIKMAAAEAPFEAGGRKYNAGTFIIRTDGNADGLRTELERAASTLGLQVAATAEAPKVAMHETAPARIAIVHTWLNTQNEGWFRIAFDKLKIPYRYISDQKLREIPNLREKFDVIVFGPVPGTSQRIVNGLPKYGPDPIPWKKTELTPNLGMSPDTTDDMRGGMGLAGVANVQRFIEGGGLFITIAANASIPIDYGLVDSVSIVPARELQARGSVLNSTISDKGSPITYGYDNKLAVYFNQTPVFQVSQTAGFPVPGDAQGARPSGRGTATDPDIPQGRPYIAPPAKPEVKPGEDPPLTDEVRESLRAYLPPAGMSPRVVLKFSDEKDLLVSGMLAGGRELAGKPVVIDVPLGKGHVLMFANNPMWRDETQGSYFLLFNAMMNYANLGVGWK